MKPPGEFRMFVEKAARSFLKPPEFSIPAFLSLAFGVAIAVAVLGNLDVASIWPLTLSSVMEPEITPEASFGIEWGSRVQTSDALQRVGSNQFFLVLAGIALAAILVAGLNLIILLRNRSTSRAHEQAVRVALGATTRQLLYERLAGAVVLFGAAAALGIVVGFLGRVGLAALWSPGFHAPILNFHMGSGLPVVAVLLFLVAAFSLSAGTGFWKPGGPGRLLTGGERLVGMQYPEGIRIFLPSLQIGLSITLLMGSSLLLQGVSSGRVVEGPGGTVPELFRLAVSAPDAIQSSQSRESQWSTLLSDLKEVPGVSEAVLFTPGAWVGVGTSDPIWTDCGACTIGGMPLRFQAPSIQHQVVSPDSFKAMGIAVTRGREFTQADGSAAPLVAIVNATYAREHFDSEGPIGRWIGLGKGQKSWHTVVGVVEDFGVSGIGSAKTPNAAVYLSVSQHPPDRANLYVGFDGEPEQGAARVLSVVERSGGFSASDELMPVEEYLARALAPLRWFGRVSTILGLLTLAVAGFGLFAILQYSVSQRSEEIGVRRALGAGRRDVIRLVLGRSTRIFLLGAFLGLEGALFLSAWIEEIAFKGQFFDVPLFLGVTGIFALAALLGSLRPTYRATKITPRAAMGGL